MSYQSRFASEDIELLFEAILKLDNKDECYRFFEDLCTIKEIQDMGQRVRVVKMLDAKIPYQLISNETHASTATISRVNKSLHYGADGYKLVLEKLKK
ncbi:MAG: YerC/YecD family TrpR-related protein [Acholeplasmataceae bacterium]|nr:YerC/YecD family TrpR-related protein [Candidatus Izemoplasmatales bacterium]